MWKNEYKSAVEKISATDAWKQQTIAAMQAAQNEQKQIVFPKKKVLALAVAACLCLAVLPAGFVLLQPKGTLSAAVNSTAATARSGEADATMQATGAADDAAASKQLPEANPAEDPMLQAAPEEAMLTLCAPQERTVWQQGEAWPGSFTLYAQDAAGVQSEFTAAPLSPEEAAAQLAPAQNETITDVQLVAVYAQAEDGTLQEQLVYRFMVQNTETQHETQIDVTA